MALRTELEARVRQSVGILVQKTLARTPLTPAALTLTGTALMCGVAGLVAWGAFFHAGVLLVIAGAFDMLDGALARARQQTSPFGAFLDSSLDRYSDALLLLGFLLYYQRTAPQSVEVILAFVAAIGAFATSYLRARAESLGYECKVGLLERPERITLIAAGLLTGFVGPMLWALAILTHLTALQRFIHVWRHARAARQAL